MRHTFATVYFIQQMNRNPVSATPKTTNREFLFGLLLSFSRLLGFHQHPDTWPAAIGVAPSSHG